MTSLNLAAMRKNRTVVKLLVLKGVDPCTYFGSFNELRAFFRDDDDWLVPENLERLNRRTASLIQGWAMFGP
jgi:hypothetical protein